MDVEPVLCPWDKSSGSWYITVFICYWIWVAGILLFVSSCDHTHSGVMGSRRASTIRRYLGGFYCVFVSVQGVVTTQRILIWFLMATWEIEIFFQDFRWVRRWKIQCVYCIKPSITKVFIMNIHNGSYGNWAEWKLASHTQRLRPRVTGALWTSPVHMMETQKPKLCCWHRLQASGHFWK